MTPTAEPPNMVTPSASENGTTIPVKSVDFCITHDTGETSSTSSQSDVQRKDVSTIQLEDKPIGDLNGMTPRIHLNRERPSVPVKEDNLIMLYLWK